MQAVNEIRNGGLHLAASQRAASNSELQWCGSVEFSSLGNKIRIDLTFSFTSQPSPLRNWSGAVCSYTR